MYNKFIVLAKETNLIKEHTKPTTTGKNNISENSA